MKKNYLKPLCMTTPMRGLRLLDGSLRINRTNVVTNSTDAGWSREVGGSDDALPSQNSVWDD